MLELFGFISGFFALIEYIPYIRDILLGMVLEVIRGRIELPYLLPAYVIIVLWK